MRVSQGGSATKEGETRGDPCAGSIWRPYNPVVFASIVLLVWPAIYSLVSPFSSFLCGVIWAFFAAGIILCWLFEIPLLLGMERAALRDIIGTSILLLLILYGQWWVYRPSDILTAMDSVEVPMLARMMLENGGFLAPGSAGLSLVLYPPGLSVPVTFLFGLMSGHAVLIVFKWLSLGTTALIPFTWAYFSRKIFHFEKIPLFFTVLAFYAGYVLFDRTINLASYGAGKNSVLFAAFLFPCVLWIFQTGSKRPLSIVLGGLATAGLWYIHYSMIQFLMLALSGLALVQKDNAARLSFVFRAALAGIVAVLVFLPRILLILQFQGALSSVSSAASPTSMMELLTVLPNNILFLFMGTGPEWPGKGMILLVMIVLSLLSVRDWNCSGETSDKRLLVATGFFFWCTALGLIIAYGWIPYAGINADYIRWFLFHFMAALFAVCLLLVMLAAWRLPVIPRVITLVLLLVIGRAGVLVVTNDFAFARDFVTRCAMSHKRMHRLESALQIAESESEGKCGVMTQHLPGAVPIFQTHRELNHIRTLSKCEIVNGSWAEDVDPLRLDEKGFLREPALRTAMSSKKLFFLGDKREREEFVRTLPSDLGIEKVRRITSSLGLFRVTALSDPGINGAAAAVGKGR